MSTTRYVQNAPRASAGATNQSIYQTSGMQGNSWGQPSVGSYVLKMEGDRMHGQLIANPAAALGARRISHVTSALEHELAAWDELSDEAWPE